MHRPGHVGAALLAYAPVGVVAAATGFRSLAVLGALGVAAIAMLPDVDVRIPFVAHRGPTHTAWFALVVGTGLGVAGVIVGASRGPAEATGLGLFGFVVGSLTIASHVAADALTPAGVRPFAPYRTRQYTYEVARASNPIANYALLGVGALSAAVAIGVGVRIARLVGV